jgi:hypothetical protein
VIGHKETVASEPGYGKIGSEMKLEAGTCAALQPTARLILATVAVALSTATVANAPDISPTVRVIGECDETKADWSTMFRAKSVEFANGNLIARFSEPHSCVGYEIGNPRFLRANKVIIVTWDWVWQNPTDVAACVCVFDVEFVVPNVEPGQYEVFHGDQK